jgi:telomerase reverse transcriptase
MARNPANKLLIKITNVDWLAPQRLMAHKTSQTDVRKRAELFYEFLYYVFDSILIPLLRSNFYVTESNTDKYRLFFFRHDVWRYVAEPTMAALKGKMFEEVSLTDANRILDSRQLGFSQVRLLPKGITARPIMNLGKKVLKRGSKTVLGPSINTMLKPVHNVLQLEKASSLWDTLYTMLLTTIVYKPRETGLDYVLSW